MSILEPAVSEAGATRERAVLVVDDQQLNRDLLLAVFRQRGFRVGTAADAESALAMALLDPPDLLVTDVVMPDIDGVELVRRIRMEPRLAGVKVIFWTGHYADADLGEIASILGVERVLPKGCGAATMLLVAQATLAEGEPPAVCAPGADAFAADHARVLTNKLYEKVEELEVARGALRAREDQFRALVSNIPGAVYQRGLDEALTIEFVSDRIEEITGYPAASLIGSRGIAYGTLVHPDDLEEVAEAVRTAVRDRGAYGLAYRLVRADGSEIWVGDRGQAVVADGAVRLYGTIADITERKRLEADRDRMEVELRVAQKLEAVGQLAAGIAHEINTPVQFVGDSVHFLRDSFDDLMGLLAAYRDAVAAVAGPAGEEMRGRLQQAEHEADLPYLEERVPAAFVRTLDGIERVASIVRAMKEFAHPQTEQAPADLNHALETTLIVARNEYKYIAEVVTDLGALPPVVCSLGDLNQVFLNLIVNAAHAIDDAGREADDGRISIRTRQEGETVSIAISDNGCGIDDDVRMRIFDPFFTTKEIGRGSGQGLALARAVVGKHGGSIEVDTELGVGTTFTVRVPIAGAPAAVEVGVA